MSRAGPLEGRRILVVEDEAATSLMIESVLMDVGCNVVGPAYDVAQALALAARRDIDCALLDVRLGNDFVYGAADVLSKHGIPIVFVTGYAPSAIDPRFASVPLIEKPFMQSDVLQAIERATHRPQSETVN
jgi:CheY-like chemotaxis protein